MADREVLSIVGPSGRVYAGKSCLSLKPSSRIRLIFVWICEQSWLETFSLIVIVANSAVLAMQGPPDNPDSPIGPVWSLRLELTFNVLFTVEMTIKIIAMGLYGHQGSYLSDGWNRLDFLVVIFGWLPFLIEELNNMSAIRSLRALRPLRSINQLPGLRLQAMTLIDSVPKVGVMGPSPPRRSCAHATRTRPRPGDAPE